MINGCKCVDEHLTVGEKENAIVHVALCRRPSPCTALRELGVAGIVVSEINVASRRHQSKCPETVNHIAFHLETRRIMSERPHQPRQHRPTLI
jgi:hypothetical protein